VEQIQVFTSMWIVPLTDLAAVFPNCEPMNGVADVHGDIHLITVWHDLAAGAHAGNLSQYILGSLPELV
jgi:hypothetical protein